MMPRANRMSGCMAMLLGALAAPVTAFAQPAQPAMGAPLSDLTADQLARFFIGRESFTHDFSVPEGLGPIFNQTSCGTCHANPVGGTGSISVRRAGSSGKGGFDGLDAFGGSLFQEQAIDDLCLEVVPPSATVFARRITNGMMGYGLVEAIPDAAIQANATHRCGDAQPAGDITGCWHEVPAAEDADLHVGRFGWKAQDPTMVTFSQGASKEELGITNPLNPTENDPNGIDPPALGECDTVADPEVGMAFIDEVVDFQRFLAAPPQTPKAGMTGEALFVSIGCADCHTESFTTADDPALEDAIRNKQVRMYSDFLLHDMGQAGDFIEQGAAGERELKTAPLAGMRVRDPMWHDGRVAAGTFAERIEKAMRWHCAFLSEAQASAKKFLSGMGPGDLVEPCEDLGVPELATPPQPCPCSNNAVVAGGLDDAGRAAVVAFLNSLGRREFDTDGDNDVDLNDFYGPEGFKACSEIDGVIDADHPCAMHDINQDGVVDAADDFDAFLSVYAGELGDCNKNSTVDLLEILVGDVPDVNQDGIPDGCQVGGEVPTVSEWGLIVMALLLLTAGTIVFGREPRVVLAAADGRSTHRAPITRPWLVPSALLGAAAVTFCLALIGLTLAQWWFGPLALRDVAGTLLSAAIFAYVLHLWVVFHRDADA